MSLDTIFEQYQLGNATLASESGIVAAKQAIEAYIAERETQARIDELERLNFKEASGFLAGGNYIVRQQVVTKRIQQLKSNERVKDE